jgi:hypothetical protein
MPAILIRSPSRPANRHVGRLARECDAAEIPMTMHIGRTLSTDRKLVAQALNAWEID